MLNGIDVTYRKESAGTVIQGFIKRHTTHATRNSMTKESKDFGILVFFSEKVGILLTTSKQIRAEYPQRKYRKRN